MFQPVSSKVKFPQLENNVLSFWKKRHIFEKSVEAHRGATQFTLYEGPPTANGSPGIHHVLSRVFKDIIPRYKAMKGYYAPRKGGWDTHGLPVELEVEKMLGFTSKAQIEDYGVAKFNAHCRESVFSYLKEWEAMTERIGFWLDLEHAYRTLEDSYIESCWWALKQLWDKGLIYQGYKVTPHCPRCGTSLSSHEVALGYRDDAEDPSVYIKFKVPDIVVKEYLQSLGANPDLPTYLLAWTTTPWTLPANTALAVANDADYAFVKIVIDGRNEQLILAKSLIESALIGQYEILGTCKGVDLAGQRLSLKGTEYEPLYRLPEHLYWRWSFVLDTGVTTGLGGLIKRSPASGENFWLITGDFVSLEEGTGIVHIAPAFGEVDYGAGYSNGLYFVQPVDERGIMIGDPRFEGRFVKDADPVILEDLKNRGLLYRSEQIVHTYPFCWRCEAPLLYYAKKTWYIRTSSKKEALISGNAEINWYPEHIKYGRFGDWLQNNVDWAFSRERYWGTTLNVWNCSSCGCYECIGSVEELKSKPNLHGLVEPLDLHRPFVDNIAFSCSKCGGEMKRQPEVIDCWFDSGAMPFAQWHYPFENHDVFNRSFPADYICEAVDQTRGWFYSLHAISTLLPASPFGRPCFKNVICLGHILDAQGEKMSKAKGNVVDPWLVLDSYGADALRWYLITSSPAGNVRRFSTDEVAEALRNFLLTLWNTYSFFVTYANIDHFEPKSAVTSTLSELDKWILSGLNQLIVDVDEALDCYDPTTAGRKIESFVDELSNWYVRRSRRRFWKSQSDADKFAAYTTLYHCLVTLSKLLAPFAPFVAEEIYQNLVCSVDSKAEGSVHLADFPVADRSQIDKKLIEATRLAMLICSLGRAARAKAGIKVRQPLPKALVTVRSTAEKKALQKLTNQILDELNVKEVEFGDVEEFTGDKPGYALAVEGDYCVAVATELSPELKAEGVAREVVRRLQTMRRSAGLDITDYIVTYYRGDDSIQQVMAKFGGYIKQETLSRELVPALPPDGSYTEKHRISGYEVLLGIKKAL
jgi:isoleucyl-tRNA synthetase